LTLVRSTLRIVSPRTGTPSGVHVRTTDLIGPSGCNAKQITSTATTTDPPVPCEPFCSWPAVLRRTEHWSWETLTIRQLCLGRLGNSRLDRIRACEKAEWQGQLDKPRHSTYLLSKRMKSDFLTQSQSFLKSWSLFKPVA
jgi:hypothetical protein